MSDVDLMLMNLRLELLKLVHNSVDPETSINTAIEMTNEYYKFITEGVTTNE